MERVIRAALIVLLSAALLAGCGDDREPTRVETPTDDGVLNPLPPFVQVLPVVYGEPTSTDPAPVAMSQAQVDAAAKAGVPAAFRDRHGMTFVYIPRGSFRMGTAEEGNEATVHIDRGFYMQVGLVRWNHMDATWGQEPRYRELIRRYKAWAEKGGSAAVSPPVGAEPDEAPGIAQELSAGPFAYRLPTEAEWAYACRAGTTTPYWWGTRPLREEEYATYTRNPWGLEDMLTGNTLQICSDRYAPLPSWERSDPTGPESGDSVVLRGGSEATATTRYGSSPSGYMWGHRPQFRLVAPVGYGLGHYGSVQVTFRLVDDEGNDAPNADYDLRVIAMNDRLAARVQNKDAVWVRIPKPKLPITLSMVPGSYYVYAEGTRDGKLVRGTEQKFHAQGATVDQIVPVPPKDVGRFGSGVQSEPK